MYRCMAGRPRAAWQVHDELLFEVEEAALPAAAARVRARMAAAGDELARARGGGGGPGGGLRVPLTVKLSAGRSWGELAPYEPSQGCARR